MDELLLGVVGLGAGAGDRVLIYMPMIPEAVIAMLAPACIGAVRLVPRWAVRL